MLIRSQFHFADTNGDNLITFSEWALATAEPSSELQRLLSRWAAFDVEGKGYMTKEEAYHRKA